MCSCVIQFCKNSTEMTCSLHFNVTSVLTISLRFKNEMLKNNATRTFTVHAGHCPCNLGTAVSLTGPLDT